MLYCRPLIAGGLSVVVALSSSGKGLCTSGLDEENGFVLPLLQATGGGTNNNKRRALSRPGGHQEQQRHHR